MSDIDNLDAFNLETAQNANEEQEGGVAVLEDADKTAKEIEAALNDAEAALKTEEAAQ